MSALVSLVMPVWHPREDWLHEAVASALDEHACDIELIVVDDGNERLMSHLLADVDDPRLRVVRREHGGPYAARNAGLAVARGEFVRFADADDVVEPGSTGRLLALAQSGAGELLAYGATMMCDEALNPQRVVTAETEGLVAHECLLGGFEVFLVSIVYPRTVLDRVGPWEERAFSVSGDWDYVLRALEEAPVRRLDEVVTRYRRHPSSVTKSARVTAGAEAAGSSSTATSSAIPTGSAPPSSGARTPTCTSTAPAPTPGRASRSRPCVSSVWPRGATRSRPPRHWPGSAPSGRATSARRREDANAARRRGRPEGQIRRQHAFERAPGAGHDPCAQRRPAGAGGEHAPGVARAEQRIDEAHGAARRSTRTVASSGICSRKPYSEKNRRATERSARARR